MKRITYAGGTVETGDAVADVLIEYVTTVAQTETNITVDIPVRESDGKIATHTLILGPATQLDVSDIDSSGPADEAKLFPVPELGQSSEIAQSAPSEEADQEARDFDEAVADIEGNLDGLGGK